MKDTMQPGTILIKDGALLPDELHLETEACARGWSLVKDFDGHGLDRAVREAGWTFFSLSDEIRSSAFGIDERAMVLRAIDRIVAKPRLGKFNSLEITRVVRRRFLGVSYISVGAQLRHIQKSLFLFSGAGLQDSSRAKLIAMQNRPSGPASIQLLVSAATEAQPEVAVMPSL